jgi:hypothetical protein
VFTSYRHLKGSNDFKIYGYHKGSETDEMLNETRRYNVITGLCTNSLQTAPEILNVFQFVETSPTMNVFMYIHIMPTYNKRVCVYTHNVNVQ